jgi:predicted amidohydrolase YtcJ
MRGSRMPHPTPADRAGCARDSIDTRALCGDGSQHPHPHSMLLPLRPLALFCLLLAATDPSAAQRPAPGVPNLILVGGKIFTADSERPWAEAIAVRGGRIVAVGRSAEIARLAGASTRRIALAGRVVIPGINDAHMHLGGIPLGTVVRTSAGAPADPAVELVLDSLRAAVRRVPRGTWLTIEIGMRVLDDPRARTQELRAALDAVAPEHPVLLTADWGHGTIVNGLGLRRLRIDEGSEPPLGGWYEWSRSDIRLTGQLREYAAWRALRNTRSLLPAAALGRAVRAELAALPRLGITSVQDMTTALTPFATMAALRGAPPTVRIRLVPVPMPTGTGEGVDEWDAVARQPSPLVRVSGVKWILDGTPLERLALMRAPYSDAPYTRGRLNHPAEVIQALLARAARAPASADRQLLLHASGDSTARLIFGYMRAIAPDSVWRARRIRIEHGDWLGGDLVPDARRLGVVLVQNPLHLALPPGMVEARFGRRRSGFQPLRAAAAAGIPIAFGSDGPVNPFLGIMLATTHPNNPSQRLTREQAVTAYTRGAAYAEFAEDEKGTLAPGMLADLVVLSQDIFTVPAAALPATTSVLTLVGGRVVHEAKGDRVPRGAGRAASPPAT